MAEASLSTGAQLRTPKAAAIAGIVFAILLIAIFVLLRSAVPGSPTEAGDWLAEDWRRAAVALNLIPFAGVAFLWFIGVLRDRLGAKEDRFFATVFFGSSLLFLGLIFTAASLVGALILVGTMVGTARAGRNTDILPGASRRIHSGQRVCRQGRHRLHGVDVDRRDLHADSAPLDCDPRLRARGRSSRRKLLLYLDDHRAAALGSDDQHCHSDR
jgi:hypothetical protein